MQEASSPGLAVAGGLAMSALAAAAAVMPRTIHTFECLDAEGRLKWTEEVANLTTNVGLADMLNRYWKGSGYTAAFYVGLKGTGTIAAGDTMASHAGWSEVAPYSNGARPTLTLGAVTGTTTASADNAAAKASFAITGSANVAGAFVTTDATVSGTAGTLIGASDFAASRTVQSGDTLNVTISVTNTSG